MTFEEAIEKKNEYSEPTIQIDGVLFELFIFPKKQLDYEDYKLWIKQTCPNLVGLTDEHAKLFSSDGEFRLGGIYYDFLTASRVYYTGEFNI